MSAVTKIFSDANLLSTLLFPYLDGVTISTVARTNKACDQASKVELLWEKLCSKNLLSSDVFNPFDTTWRDNWLLFHNWNHGRYREGPVRNFESKNLRCLMTSTYYKKPRVIVSVEDGIKIRSLIDDKEIYIKGVNIDTNIQSLHHCVVTDTYTILKTEQEIQVYQNTNGNLLYKFKVNHPSWREPTVTCDQNILASLDNNGTELKVWDLTTGEMSWEKDFSEYLGKKTRFFAFVHCFTELNLYWCSSKDNIWLINFKTKTIQKDLQLKDLNWESNPAAVKNEMLETRIKKYKDRGERNQNLNYNACVRKMALNAVQQYHTIIKGAYVVSNFDDNMYANWVNLISLDRRERYSFLRLWNRVKPSSIFLKKFDNLFVETVLFSKNKLFIGLSHLNNKKIEIRTYDFHPSSNPTTHPEHLEESALTPPRPASLIGNDPPGIPLRPSLFLRIALILERIFKFFWGEPSPRNKAFIRRFITGFSLGLIRP